MPYAIIPVEGGFKVVNTSSGKIHAAHTTRDKAEAQVRLLRGVEHGMTVRGHREVGTRNMGVRQEPEGADQINPAPTPLKRGRRGRSPSDERR